MASYCIVLKNGRWSGLKKKLEANRRMILACRLHLSKESFYNESRNCGEKYDVRFRWYSGE